MELYRTAIKYGITPTYEGETPVYWDSEHWYRFVCWTDKDGNEIEEFTPITGNTYIYAKYEIGGSIKQEDNSVTVTFTFEGDNGERFEPDVTSIECPKGSTYVFSGETLTINGTTYTLYYPSSLVSFDYWTKDDVTISGSGTIDADTVISAHFAPV